MPGIVEVTTPVTPASSLKTPSTPRIDISRASSSSQHEDSNSRESTPEKELLAGEDKFFSSSDSVERFVCMCMCEYSTWHSSFLYNSIHPLGSLYVFFAFY